MPELPEVETTRRGVAPYCVGKVVSQVTVREPRLRWPVPIELPGMLAGLKITALERRAKYLLFRTERGSLLIHLGMSGSLRVVALDDEPRKHDHIDIVFENAACLRFHDPRRFGSLHWVPLDDNHKLLNHLGPEPLSEAFDGQMLYRRSRGRSCPVKSFIMDGKVVVGVGNIYANEALFLAGIHPRRAAGRISLKRYEVLADQIKRVLTSAIRQGGTTLRDFVGGDGSPGYFAQQLFVYDRGGERCKRCDATLKEIRLGQRSTVFCVTCQR
ncbi:MAG: bifunctional DNA-formamidopyrimidine glycosylase/DNA-(apurinic or apyrimidinic site) lyase [Pseudomonadota bacterium]